MSQINTDNDDNCGWTPVRSKKMIKSLKEKDHERPPTPGMVIASSPLRGSPTFCEQIPIITDTNAENIIKKPEIITEKSEIITEKSEIITEKAEIITEKTEIITEKPNIIIKKSDNIDKMKSGITCENSGNKVKPIINQAVHFLDEFKEQMINKTNINNQSKDQWDVAFEFLKVQQTILMNSLNVVSNELKYPYFLRGKSDEQRNIEINDRLFKIVNDILIIIKEERQVKNEWIDTMSPGKITGMIIQS
jgi:hypothetical protein